MDLETRYLLSSLGAGIIIAFIIMGLAWFLERPELNTVTLHKQDRLSLPCPDRGGL